MVLRVRSNAYLGVGLALLLLAPYLALYQVYANVLPRLHAADGTRERMRNALALATNQNQTACDLIKHIDDQFVQLTFALTREPQVSHMLKVTAQNARAKAEDDMAAACIEGDGIPATPLP